MAHHIAALEIMVRLENWHDALWTLVNCTHVERRLGHFAGALRIAGAVEAQLSALKIGLPNYHMTVLTEAVEASTRAVGEGEAAVFQREGRTLSLVEALDLIKQESVADMASAQNRLLPKKVVSGASH